MAFSLDGLVPMSSSANGPRHWNYTTEDPIATVNTAAYFNDASDLLQIRDIIWVFDTNVPTTNICSVLTNASGVVDISDGTPISETDTD